MTSHSCLRFLYKNCYFLALEMMFEEFERMLKWAECVCVKVVLIADAGSVSATSAGSRFISTGVVATLLQCAVNGASGFAYFFCSSHLHYFS